MSNDSFDNHIVIRPFLPDADLLRLVNLLTQVEAFDREGESVSEEALRKQLTWPRHERWVVPAPGDPDQLIGYGSAFAQTKERSALYVAVRPDWRRRGLGSALLDCALGHAIETGAAQVTIYANARNKAANDFLRQRNFTLVGAAWVMHAAHDVPLAEPEWPAGYTVHSHAVVQDLPALVRVSNRSYHDMWGHWENTEGAVTEEEMARWLPAFDPEGIWIAFAPNGDVAGTCRVQLAQDNDGEVMDILDGPGVVPEHRHHKLQRPLVLTAMHWQRARSSKPVRLESWGDDEQTIALYRDLGFDLDQHYVAYRLNLARAG